jgi:retron-type reverse transcriptase
MPQGLPLSPILAIYTLDHYLKRHKLEPVLYADDGILFCNDLKVIDDFINSKLERVGIILSKKMKDTMRPATGLIKGEFINFVGMQ